MRRWKDESGELQAVFKQVRERYPEETSYFQHMKINFTFRDPPEKESDGVEEGEEPTFVAGMAKKLTPREHDLYGYNAEIEIAAEIWKKSTNKQRFRLMWHEMNHIQLELEEDNNPKPDSEGRLKVWIQQHDVLIRTFVKEARMFGLQPGELRQVHELLDAHREFEEDQLRKEERKKKKAQKEARASVDTDDEPSSGRKKKKRD